jgi:hypothetical protein
MVRLVKIIAKVAVAAALGLMTVSSMAEEVIGVIKSSKGQVVVERAGAQFSAVRGSEVLKGDRVITGADGVATIAMRRAAPVNIGPENDVFVDRFAAGEIPLVKRPPPAILQSLASFLAVNRQR